MPVMRMTDYLAQLMPMATGQPDDNYLPVSYNLEPFYHERRQ
jgi:hypothetical protein